MKSYGKVIVFGKVQVHVIVGSFSNYDGYSNAIYKRENSRAARAGCILVALRNNVKRP